MTPVSTRRPRCDVAWLRGAVLHAPRVAVMPGHRHGGADEGTVSSRRLSEAFRAFAEAITSDFDRDVLIDQLVHQTAAAVGADGAGMLLPDQDGALRFAAATDRAVREVEEEQALREQGEPPTTPDGRWPSTT